MIFSPPLGGIFYIRDISSLIYNAEEKDDTKDGKEVKPMTEEAKATKRAYQREYYRRNRERILKQKEAYWERKYAEQQKAEQCQNRSLCFTPSK